MHMSATAGGRVMASGYNGASLPASVRYATRLVSQAGEGIERA